MPRGGALYAVAAASLLVGVPHQSESPPGDPVNDPNIINAAKNLYGMNSVKMYTLVSPELNEAFPDFDLYAAMDLRRHPVEMHAMAIDRTPLHHSHDVTKNFTVMMALQGVVLNNVSQAVKYGKAFAALANPELQGEWTILRQEDSVRLNRTIVNPIAGSILNGWNVTLTTLQTQNGVLSNWTIIFKANTLDNAECAWSNSSSATTNSIGRP